MENFTLFKERFIDEKISMASHISMSPLTEVFFECPWLLAGLNALTVSTGWQHSHQLIKATTTKLRLYQTGQLGPVFCLLAYLEHTLTQTLHSKSGPPRQSERVFSCLHLRHLPLAYLMTVSDWFEWAVKPGRHVLVTVSEQGANIGGRLYISFYKTAVSTAFIFSIAKRIQPEFRYDIKTGVFFIGKNFEAIWWEAALLSPSQNMCVYKEQIEESANVFTCMGERHLQQYTSRNE